MIFNLRITKGIQQQWNIRRIWRRRKVRFYLMKNIYKMKFVWLLCFFEGVGWWNLCYINLGGSGKKTGEHNANYIIYILWHRYFPASYWDLTMFYLCGWNFQPPSPPGQVSHIRPDPPRMLQVGPRSCGRICTEEAWHEGSGPLLRRHLCAPVPRSLRSPGPICPGRVKQTDRNGTPLLEKMLVYTHMNTRCTKAGKKELINNG